MTPHPTRRQVITGLSAILGSSVLAVPAHAKAPLWDGARYAFLGSSTQPKIVAIDVDQHRLETVIDLPFVPGSLAVSQDHDLLFATDLVGKAVGIVDLHSNEYIGSNLLGLTPDVALISPADGYITYAGPEGQISIWELHSNREALRLRDFGPITSLTYSRDGGALFSVNTATKEVLGIDLRSGDVVQRQALPGKTNGRVTPMSRSLDGRHGLLALPDDDLLIVLDLRNLDVLHSIKTAQEPGRPYASGDGQFVLVPHKSGRAVSIFSATDYSPVAVFDTKAEISEVVTGWLDSTAFAISTEAASISVIDLFGLEMGAAMQVPAPPRHSLTNSDSRIVTTTLGQDGAVGLIDASSRQLATVIETGVCDLTQPVMAVSGNICH